MDTKETDIQKQVPLTVEKERVSMNEIGLPGLNYYGGYVYEEHLPTLAGSRAITVFNRMSKDDPTVGAILFAAEQLIKRASWRVEAGSDNSRNQEAADFLASCKEDMDPSWSDFIAEALSFLVFGWSYHEIVYKRRLAGSSAYKDGKVGWKRLAGRAQTSLYQWHFDENGELLGMTQIAPPDFKQRFIPYSKALLFRTKANRGNPEGQSALRNAYRPWYFKTRIEEIEGIGIERDLAGLPVLVPPEGVDIWNTLDPDAVSLKLGAEKIVRSIRRDQNEGVVLPFGWDLKLLSSSSKRQFDTNAIINRYDQRIAMTMLADLVMLGADKVGSFALADVKKSMFATALESFLDVITNVVNKRAVPKLLALNGFDTQDPPYFVHGGVDTPDLDQLGRFLIAMNNIGVRVFEEPKVRNYLREVSNLPLSTLTEEEQKAEIEREKEERKEMFQNNNNLSNPRINTQNPNKYPKDPNNPNLPNNQGGDEDE